MKLAWWFPSYSNKTCSVVTESYLDLILEGGREGGRAGEREREKEKESQNCILVNLHDNANGILSLFLKVQATLH